MILSVNLHTSSVSDIWLEYRKKGSQGRFLREKKIDRKPKVRQRT